MLSGLLKYERLVLTKKYTLSFKFERLEARLLARLPDEFMPAPKRSTGLIVSCVAAALAWPSFAAAPSETEAKDAARSAVAQMTPHDVGSRYGQALGVIEICPGAQTTVKVPALNTIYTGADLQTFQAQASRIFNAWIKLKQCGTFDDPNECRVVVEESCAAALIEIGPTGTVFPGLLEGPGR